MILDILMVIGIIIIVFHCANAVVTMSKAFKPTYRYCDPEITVYLMMKGMKRN